MRRMTIGLVACAFFTVTAASFAGQPPPLEKAKPSRFIRDGEAQHPPVVERNDVEIGPAIVLPAPLPPDYDNENAGLSRGTHPELLTWDRIYALAVVRARTRRGAFLPSLDPEALAAEAARQGVGDFARFRSNFHSNGPFHDPGPAVLELQSRLLAVDGARRTVVFYESVHKLIAERSQGVTSGVNGLDVQTVFAALLQARQKLADDIRQFRDGLDELKFLLGLSPRAPVILDRQYLKAFSAVFDSVDNWQRRTRRWLHDLPLLIERFPAPGDVIINGEPILTRIEKDSDQWEDILASAGQLAIKSRSERDENLTQPNSGVQLELRIRRRIRSLFEKRLAYQHEKRRYELATILRDQAFERLVAPPPPVITSRSSLLKGVIEQQSQIVEAQDRLVALWTSFRAERLALYHDLGVLPYQDWKSFYADLSAAPAVAAPEVPAVQPNPSAGDAPQPPAPPTPPRP
jgi:hypothetical protein